MGTVFISYRREETAGEARALFNDLVARIGKDLVFMDVDNIALGRDFREVLRENLASCDLMLVLIGKRWVDAKDQSGRRRLDDPGDFIRLEIGAALKRNIPVTPVLVQGASTRIRSNGAIDTISSGRTLRVQSWWTARTMLAPSRPTLPFRISSRSRSRSEAMITPRFSMSCAR